MKRSERREVMPPSSSQLAAKGWRTLLGVSAATAAGENLCDEKVSRAPSRVQS